jgi:hypothetical protein
LALLLDRPDPLIRQWEALTEHRRLVAVAASDAHARIGVRSLGEPYDSAGSLHFPSYTTSFREFSIALPDVTLTRNAESDAERVLDAIRGGHVYTTVDALGGPAAVRFAAGGGANTVSMGDAIAVHAPVHLHVDAQAPDDATIALYKDGIAVAQARGSRLDYDPPGAPAAYHVEIALPGAPGTPPVPWIFTNPVYVGRNEGLPASSPRDPPHTFTTLYDGGPARGWRIEKNPASDAAVDVIGALGGSQLLLRYAISGTPADNPYVAFVTPVTAAIALSNRIVFTARADRPMRISIQLRGAGGDAERWRRSLYLDSTRRTVDVGFDEFRPVTTGNSPFDLSKIESLLFVIDTVNTKSGANGQIQLDDVRYAR